MTRLCVPIFVHTLEQAKRDVDRAIEAGADLVELRMDTVQGIDLPHALLQAFPRGRFVVTRRAERQGGQADDHDWTRLFCLSDDADYLTDGYVDVEFDSDREAVDLALDGWLNGGKVIFSHHDFKTRPTDLTKTFLAMHESKAGVVKLAWQARSIRDNLEAFELMQAGPKPTIAICMGEAGAISRILAGKFGAFCTFASLSDTSATAPGQLTIAELKNTYRWDAITRATKVYGVVGAPIAHSMSPAVHNAGFDAVGFDGVYVPLLVQSGYDSFKAFMETFRAFAPLDLAGLSITIPHKENALRYAREAGGFDIDPLAERIGAVNTFAFRADSKSRATSTDYGAILDTITTSLSIDRSSLKNLRVAIVGAGGTGRTAVAALAHFGARVTIFNRTRDRAEALATEFDTTAAPLESLGRIEADVFVNTTSLGMSPAVDASIFDAGVPPFTPRTLVFDTVYNPMETKLLRQARAAGAIVASGAEMFVRQAVGQFELWTDRPAPIDVMRQVIEHRLTTPA